MLQDAYIPYDFMLCHVGLNPEGGEEQLRCLCWGSLGSHWVGAAGAG